MILIFIMLMLTVLSMFMGTSYIGVLIQQAMDYNAALNGTTSQWVVDPVNTSLYLDPLIGAVVWIGIIAAIGIAAGIQFLGSGLNSEGGHWLTGSIFYTAIWIILSTYPFGLLMSIPYFGALSYISLTMVYAIAVIMKINSFS